MCNSKHFDVVGSFLRPESLKQARKAFECHEISHEELEVVENEAIKELIDKQIEAGLPYVTDGEFRRALWHLDFFWGFNGVDRVILEQGYLFEGLETRSDSARIVAPIDGKNHPFLKHYKFVRDYAQGRVEVKQTIPAPAQFIVELYRPENVASTQSFYPDRKALIQDISQAYIQVVNDLYDLGCRHIQFDDCTWGGCLEDSSMEKIGISKEVLPQILNEYLEINNSVFEKIASDVRVSTHVCRGNYHSHHAFSGSYKNVAPVLFQKEKVKTYYLEFDDIRSGDFTPLQEVSGDKHVVLGLITTKRGELEDKEEVIQRIREAAKIIPLARLHLSPQCGFASTEEGNILTEKQQWDKIKLVKEIAEEVW